MKKIKKYDYNGGYKGAMKYVKDQISIMMQYDTNKVCLLHLLSLIKIAEHARSENNRLGKILIEKMKDRDLIL